MLLFNDTETNKLLDFKRDLMEPDQARICELAAILTDEEGNVQEELNCLIKPDGWAMEEEASSINGITMEMLEKDGVPIREAMEKFLSMKARAKTRISHNISYDKRMLARETLLLGLEHNSEGMETFCTMTASKPICQLPPTNKMMAAGFKSFKSPKLQEAYQHFYGKEFEGAHRAMDDTRACMAIYFKLRELSKAAA